MPVAFHIPFYIPFLAALTVICASAAIYLRLTQTNLELLYRDDVETPLKDQLLILARALFQRLPAGFKYFFNPTNTEEMLIRAGRPYQLTSEEFIALRMIAVGIALLSILTALVTEMLWIFLIVLVIKLPDWYLQYLAYLRLKKMDREFLIVAVRLASSLKGMNLTAALKWAAKTKGIRDGSPLRDELNQCIQELGLDATMNTVFMQLAERTGLLSIRRMVLAVLNAHKGISVADRLQEAVDDARDRRKNEIIGQAKSAEGYAELALFVMAIAGVLLTLGPMTITYLENGLF